MPNIKPGTRAPLLLGSVLSRHGISQGELAERIKQPSGKPMSRVAINQLVNHNEWPRTTPRDEIVQITESMLRERGVSDDEIADIWQIDPAAPAHQGNPAARRPAFTPENIPDIPEVTEMLTPAARKAFSLFRDPFQDDVSCADDVFLAPDQRYIREAMYMAGKHGGFLAVVGESGAGKSVLRRDLLDRIAREQAPISVIMPRTIDKPKLNAGAIFEAIISDLLPGATIKRSMEAKARQAEHLLRDSSRAGNTHVLLIEEAHDLSIQTLKVLKRFWEIEDGFKRLLAIVLIGQPELKMKLDERHNFEAREVIRRCEIAELMPLDQHLESYIGHKFQRVGREFREVLAPDACDAIRARLTRRNGQAVTSMLYPLVVNNLLTKAMNHAAEIGEDRVSGDVVRAL